MRSDHGNRVTGLEGLSDSKSYNRAGVAGEVVFAAGLE